MFTNLFLDSSTTGAAKDFIGDLTSTLGVDLFDEDIDNVVFATNAFLCNDTFIGANGPFWYILQMSMCLGAMFAICVGGGMAYKMMVKGEPIDVLKIVKIFGISLILFFWYPSTNSTKASVLDLLAYIPNCIGSYTHDLYEAEAIQVDTQSTDQAAKAQKDLAKAEAKVDFAGTMIGFDKVVMFFALVIYKIGWWSTIFCQQILLGMLTIFGPITIAFSVLPKWEGAWAKWMIRYLTVHFYGAMLYFVGLFHCVTH